MAWWWPSRGRNNVANIFYTEYNTSCVRRYFYPHTYAWRVMAADRPYGEVYDFYGVSPEYFGYTSYHRELPSVKQVD
jgi:hypothetical protein